MTFTTEGGAGGLAGAGCSNVGKELAMGSMHGIRGDQDLVARGGTPSN
jgi:hypothetical protein